MARRETAARRWSPSARRHRPGRVRRGGAAVCAALATLASLAFAAAAFASPGDLAWKNLAQRTTNGADAYAALAVTAAGGALVAGSTAASADADRDVLVRAFGARGKTLWRRVWTWPGRSDDYAAAAVRDRKGSFIVAGSSGSSWLLLKYRSDGYLLWARRGLAPFAKCSLVAVAVTRSGDVYAAGAARSPGEDRRYLLLKYSAAGAFRWRATFGSTSGDASAAGVAVAGTDVVVTGRFTGAGGGTRCATVRYSASGEKRWEAFSPAADGHAAEGLEVLADDGVTVLGDDADPARAGADGFVLRYAADGAPRWTASVPVTEPASGVAFADAALGPSGSTGVSGWRWSPAGDQLVTLAIDAGGAVTWQLVGTEAGTRGLAVAAGPAASWLVAGGGRRLDTASLSATGAEGWRRAVDVAGCSSLTPAAVLPVGSKAVYVAGTAAKSGGGTAAAIFRLRQ